MLRNHLSKPVAVLLALGAVCAPVASATDLRSPDARDAALSVEQDGGYQLVKLWD